MKNYVYINRSWIVAYKYVEQTLRLRTRYTLYCTPVYRDAISVVYLVLTILQFNSSSSLSIIGYVTEVKEFLMGH